MSMRIKELIKEKGETIQSISEKIGVNRVSLTNSINGNPTVDTLEKIASALDVSIAEFFEKTSNDSIICPNCGKKFKMDK